MKLKVLKRFQDIKNGSIYEVDQVIELENGKRADSLVQRGLCEVEADADEDPVMVTFLDVDYEIATVKEALTSIKKGVAGNAGINGVSKRIAELTEEETQALFEALTETE